LSVVTNRKTDPYGGRFARDASSSGVAAGYEQAVQKLDKAAIKRGIAPYKKYGFDQDIPDLQKMDDQSRYDMAAKAVIAKFKGTRTTGPKPGPAPKPRPAPRPKPAPRPRPAPKPAPKPRPKPAPKPTRRHPSVDERKGKPTRQSRLSDDRGREMERLRRKRAAEKAAALKAARRKAMRDALRRIPTKPPPPPPVRPPGTRTF